MPGETAFVLAEIGVVILLFAVGLEVRTDDLLAVGRPAVLTAVIAMVLPIAAGVAIGLLLGESVMTAAFVGLALAATSIGITSRVLADMGVLDRTFARVVLGAAVIDDVLALIAIGIVSGAAEGRPVGLDRCSSPWPAIGLVGLGFAAARRARGLKREVFTFPMFADTPLVPAFILMFGLALVSAAIGLAAIIGAFVAGLIVAETEAQDELEHEIRPLRQIFTPFFFAVTGAQLDLGALLEPSVAALAIGLAVVGHRDQGGRWLHRRALHRALGRRWRSASGWSRVARSASSWPIWAWPPGCCRPGVFSAVLDRGGADDARRAVPAGLGDPAGPGRVAARRPRRRRRRSRSAAAEQPAPVVRLGLGRATTTGPPQDGVDLVAIRAPDGHAVEPLDVLEVGARDLAQRPARIATEVEDAARRVAGWRAGGAGAVRVAHRVVVPAADRRASARPVARDRLRRARRGRSGVRRSRRRGRARRSLGRARAMAASSWRWRS